MAGILHWFVEVTQLLSAISGWRHVLFSEMIVKGTILLFTAFVLTLVLRRASAASRHLAWTLALCAVLALPVFALALPAWEVPIYSSPPSIAAAAVTSPHRLSSADPLKHQLVQVTVTGHPARPGWPGMVLFAWALGSIFFMTRMAVGQSRARSLARRSRLLQTSKAQTILEGALERLRISRAVELRTDVEIVVPFTRGVFRPAIFLPEGAREWSGERLEFVLAHELAHVSRHDCLTQMPAQAACAVLWFHPLVWFAASQMRKERERACDDMVLNLGHQAADYAEFLVMLCRSLPKAAPAWSTNIAMAQSSQLEVRMKALLDPKLNHSPLVPIRVLFAAALTIALLVPAAAMRATAKNGTGSISGTVHDPSGAVIPGAGVILISSQTQTRIASQTGDDGTFNFPAIPAGRYRLEFAKPGFARTLTGEFELGPSRDLEQSFTLNLGWVSEELVVRGHRPSEAAAAPPRPPHRIRVGGLVQAAKLIKIVKPVYPASAEKQGTEGTVIMRAVIGTNGQVLSLEPYNGADPALIKAAMDAVGQWHYQPTLLNGAPVEVATTVTVIFRLDQ